MTVENRRHGDKSLQDRIEKDARRALLWNAFFRLESALIIGGTILLTVFVKPFPGWPIWAWPLVGAIGEAAVIISTLTDRGEMQKVMESMFREKYNFRGIRNRELRAKLEEADQYRRRIQQLANQQDEGPLRDRMVATTSDVYEWIGNMARLAERIDTYRMDMIIKTDLQEVPGEIKTLQQRYNMEADAQVREQMGQTLESKQRQLENLQELGRRMQRADLQLDHSLSALGTVYAQMLLIGSKDVDSDRAARLQEDIRNEVAMLGDLVDSLNEVYSGGLDAAMSEAGDISRPPRQMVEDPR
jgi:hypothetical protein